MYTTKTWSLLLPIVVVRGQKPAQLLKLSMILKQTVGFIVKTGWTIILYK